MGTPSLHPFRWQDGERVIRFGRGALDDAPELLGQGYALLSTPRARAAAPPALMERAAAVHDVPGGRVDDLAAELRPQVSGSRLVALGGGRVIDVAKALAAADPPRSVAAVPTTLSGAEMTRLHRHATGVAPETPHVRPAVVVTDPALAGSQPEPALAASALNSLAHAIEAAVSAGRNPAATVVAHSAIGLLAAGFADPGAEPDRDALALGALLSGWASDAAGYGLHHVMSQTLVRLAGVGHGPANAVMLPHTVRALGRRFPHELDAMAQELGDDMPSVAARLLMRAGPPRLRERGVRAEQLAECAEAAAGRPELAATPPPADRDELLALYEAAW